MWKQRPFDEEIEKKLLAQGKSRLLSRLLAQRNIDPETMGVFLESDYKNLSHPFTLHDVEKASKIFMKIVKNKGKVAILSDYDCDGVVSAVLLKELCNNFTLDCQVFLPSRINLGYGLSTKTVNAFIDKLKHIPDLLIIADCGTNNSNEIELLKEHGIKEVIVIDHHLLRDNISENADALVSWHLGGNFEMCAAGEIFQFIRGIYQLTDKINPIEFLTYAAIGTVADVSPIIGDNRIIVKNGLTTFAINHVKASGLTALMKHSKIYAPSITQMDVSFKIAPKINAAGRVFHPDIVYDLLIERDPDLADKIADHIGSYNDERKDLQKKIEQEAILCTECDPINTTHGILVSKSSWHVGIVGISASTLTEEFNKPAIVVGNNNGIWKGSGRSVKGVNLKEILDLCPEMFVTYGGHAAAVGVTLKEEYLDRAPAIFNAACKKYYETHNIEKENCNLYDAKLGANVINEKTSKMIADNLYPYCESNNSEPVFMLPDAIISNPEIRDGKGWKLLTFYAENKIRVPYPFKMFSPKFGTEIEGRKADIYFSFPQHYEIKPNQYNQFELMVSEIVFKD